MSTSGAPSMVAFLDGPALRRRPTHALAPQPTLRPHQLLPDEFVLGDKLECWINECNGNPHYIRGVALEALPLVGAKNPKIDVRGFDGHACTYVVSWD